MKRPRCIDSSRNRMVSKTSVEMISNVQWEFGNVVLRSSRPPAAYHYHHKEYPTHSRFANSILTSHSQDHANVIPRSSLSGAYAARRTGQSTAGSRMPEIRPLRTDHRATLDTSSSGFRDVLDSTRQQRYYT
jgi:hypothetical protein